MPAIMLALRTASRNDINVRSAFVHMLGDALGSVAIIGGAIAIRFTGWMQVDPILSILIGVMVVWTAWDIVRESLNILLEGSAPRHQTAGCSQRRCAASKACWTFTTCTSGASARAHMP